MALSKDTYRQLEDVVGTENISEEQAVLDGYSFFSFGIMSPKAEARFFSKPEAVVLPGSTGEVQAIIKLCQRRGIKSKASSTCYLIMNAVGGEGVIVLDMRRMNRILEIDEKNMFIVVEPYVSFAQVQAEANKRGLNCHVIAAGSQCSYLASHTSVHGTNPQGISHGFSGRNLLGVEWVLPTGEVLKLGSLGSGAGWFSGDGPGPSLRGIMRGSGGAKGGLGVFTKCASHLHPWPGPPKVEITGRSPYYETEVPPLFEYHVVDWPSWEKCADALHKIGDAGIAYAMHKTGGPGSHGAIVTGSNNEYFEKRQAGELAITEVSFAIVTAGNSPGEHEYQVKVLKRILADTRGTIALVGEEPIWKNRDYISMLKMCFVPRGCMRLTGGGFEPLTALETTDHCLMGLGMDARLRGKYVEKGIIMDDGTYTTWDVPFEGNHWNCWESVHFADPTNEESCMGAAQMVEEATEMTFKKPLAVSWAMFMYPVEQVGQTCLNFHKWMRKIKKTFDPDTVSDPSGYISAE